MSERAYTAYLNDGNRRRAGFVALGLARDFLGRRNPSVGKASVEYGYLARMRGTMASDPEEALAHARRAYELGSRFGDADLTALGLHDQGRILIAKGHVAEGMALLDEATLPAV